MNLLLLSSRFFVILLCFSATVFAQDPVPTFKVQDGAFPWHDRVNVWSLDGVPDSLKSDVLLPQQSCSSRGLEVPGTPAAILFGVSEADLAAVKEKYPTAKETEATVSVKNSEGGSLSYKVLRLEKPPEKIVGGGQAGLLLLKVENSSGNVPSPKAASPPGTDTAKKP